MCTVKYIVYIVLMDKNSSVIHTYGQYLPHWLMRFLSVIEIVCIENLDLMIFCVKT